MCPYLFHYVSLCINACVLTHNGTPSLSTLKKQEPSKGQVFIAWGWTSEHHKTWWSRHVIINRVVLRGGCFIGISGWRGLQHLIPGTMLKGITTWQTHNEDTWYVMRPHVIYREDVVVNPWGHMIYVMRTYVIYREDTCKLWSIFLSPPIHR